MAKALFIDWCPKDILDSTHTLSPWEELAYRRLLDLVVVTGDELPDDDKRLAWMTKTGRRWPAIKAALISYGKIAVLDGRIRVAEASDALQKTARKMAQKSQAGRASAESRKMLEKQETSTADVAHSVATAEQLPTNPRTHKEKKQKKEGARQGGRGSYVGDLRLAGDDDRSTWEMLVKGYSADRPWSWPVFRGPKPDEPGCYAPPDLLAKHGFRPTPQASGPEVCHG